MIFVLVGCLDNLNAKQFRLLNIKTTDKHNYQDSLLTDHMSRRNYLY